MKHNNSNDSGNWSHPTITWSVLVLKALSTMAKNISWYFLSCGIFFFPMNEVNQWFGSFIIPNKPYSYRINGDL